MQPVSHRGNRRKIRKPKAAIFSDFQAHSFAGNGAFSGMTQQFISRMTVGLQVISHGVGPSTDARKPVVKVCMNRKGSLQSAPVSSQLPLAAPAAPAVLCAAAAGAALQTGS